MSIVGANAADFIVDAGGYGAQRGTIAIDFMGANFRPIEQCPFIVHFTPRASPAAAP